MQYVFRLSGESPSLAIAELQALFETFDFKFTKCENNFITVETSASKKDVLKLCNRSAFVKRFYIANKELWRAEKGRFLSREPQQKPAFHPTTLKPKLARVLTNLARAKETLLDPFCGAGSILIEATILGAKVIGIDFDEKMISYSKKNLDFYKCKNYKLKLGDSTRLDKLLKLNSIDAIATDLPYGRSSRASLKNLEILYGKFLNSANKVMKKKKYLAFFYPNYINTKKLVSKKWKLVSEAELYVHGGLTRKLLVLRKQ